MCREATTRPASSSRTQSPWPKGLEPITGLGDDAFFGAVAGMQVSVVKGDVYLSVTVPFGTTDADATTVRTLAPLAVGRLP